MKPSGSESSEASSESNLTFLGSLADAGGLVIGTDAERLADDSLPLSRELESAGGEDPGEAVDVFL